jgi:oligoribonuclease
MSNEIVWADGETTCLDENKGFLLEFALAVTDRDLVPTDVEQVVIKLPPGEREKLTPFIVGMHTANGLLEESEASGVSVSEADDTLCTFLDRVFGKTTNFLTLAGSSVHFDLRWANRHLPKFAKRLHYRIFDVTTIKTLARTEFGYAEPQGEPAHRALDDVFASIAAYADCLAVMKGTKS